VPGVGFEPARCRHLRGFSLVKAFTGIDMEGVADVDTQLRLIHDEVIPAV